MKNQYNRNHNERMQKWKRNKTILLASLCVENHRIQSRNLLAYVCVYVYRCRHRHAENIEKLFRLFFCGSFASSTSTKYYCFLLVFAWDELMIIARVSVDIFSRFISFSLLFLLVHFNGQKCDSMLLPENDVHFSWEFSKVVIFFSFAALTVFIRARQMYMFVKWMTCIIAVYFPLYFASSKSSTYSCQ